jgi:Ni/Co efflux regulator RcnB
MIKLVTAVAAAVTMFTAAPSFVASTPAQADNIKMAQVDVQIGRDRERERARGDRRDRDVDVTVGRRGVVVGPREHCRTVTTTVERDDGRRVRRTERRCD